MVHRTQLRSYKSKANNIRERARNVNPLGIGDALLNGSDDRSVFEDYNSLRANLADNIPQLDENTLPNKVEYPLTTAPGIQDDKIEYGLDKIQKECSRIEDILSGLEKDLENGNLEEIFVDKHSQLEEILRNFPDAFRKMSKRRKGRDPLQLKDEYDLQYILNIVLSPLYEDVREEENSPSHGGSSSRIDFLIKDGKLAIETKYCREGMRSKDIKSQLSEDVEHYRSHPDCNTLICLVYDPDGNIENPTGFENDLSGDRGALELKTIVIPR